MSIRNLFDQVKHEIELPQIDGDACVHALIEQASCQSCVDACPRDAWILDDSELGLDTEACDGCGLCRPACPQSVISFEHQPELRSFKGHGLAIVACERTGLQGEGVIPCLHSLDLFSLLRLHKENVRMLLYSCGDCGNCDRSRASQNFEQLLGRFQQLIKSHQLPKLQVAAYKPQGWARRREQLAVETPRGQELSRRGFLRNMARQSLEKALPPEAAGEHRESLAAMFPQHQPDGLFPHVPRIDATLCNACDTCTQVCPHKAISLQSQPLGYKVDAQHCTACRLCVDICEQNAIEIAAWTRSEQQVLSLAESQCRGCGTLFHHQPEQDQPDAQPLCRICANHGHHKKLFQVL